MCIVCMPGDELLYPDAFLMAWLPDRKRLNNVYQCTVKSQEWAAAGAGDALDFGLQNVHIYLFCSGTSGVLSFPARKEGRICGIPVLPAVQ